MTRPAYDVKAAARRLVERTRTAQGLPATVSDPVVLRRIAVLIERRPQRRAS